MLALLRNRLEHSPLKRPVLLQATDTSSGHRGEVYAIVNHPMSEVAASLGKPVQWCEAMLLHINNRACSVAYGAAEPAIALSVVRRYDQPLDAAFKLNFDFHVIEATQRHLALWLVAADGPLGTSNYRIEFEAIPADATHSFVRFSYSYDENTLAAAGMRAYLATFGRSKVGFTVTGHGADAQPAYIDGSHGLLERNAMRYYLTFEALLAGHDALARRNAWFSATEDYPRQLHEVDRATYLELKAADGK